MRACFLAALGAVMLVANASAAFAHGLQMELVGQDDRMVGVLQYSSGARASGEWVQITDLTDPAAQERTVQTGPDGGFQAKGLIGHTYRVTGTAEEGHAAILEVTLRPAAIAAELSASRRLPPWVLMAGLLLLSIPPAVWMTRRFGGRPND